MQSVAARLGCFFSCAARRAGFLRGSVLLALGLAALAGPLAAAGSGEALRPSGPAVRAELAEVVARQLQAWREDRTADAYACASTTLRAQFPLAAFVAMVRRGYPEIAANRSAEFGIARDDGARAEIFVRVVPARGAAVRYRYLLIREPDGWRIHGVIPDDRRRDDV